MRRIAEFMKVSEKQFAEDLSKTNENISFEKANDAIRLPKRATKDSAGYDFFSPFGFYLNPGKSIVIPTGIRVKMEPGWVLELFPRSGLGFQYRIQLANTVGIIDGDYFNANNEGHIMIKLTNDSKEKKTLFIGEGQKFAQGIFHEYGITIDDDADEVRKGGFGSTGR